jgi:hypothetical protein
MAHALAHRGQQPRYRAGGRDRGDAGEPSGRASGAERNPGDALTPYPPGGLPFQCDVGPRKMMDATTNLGSLRALMASQAGRGPTSLIGSRSTVAGIAPEAIRAATLAPARESLIGPTSAAAAFAKQEAEAAKLKAMLGPAGLIGSRSTVAGIAPEAIRAATLAPGRESLIGATSTAAIFAQREAAAAKRDAMLGPAGFIGSRSTVAGIAQEVIGAAKLASTLGPGPLSLIDSPAMLAGVAPDMRGIAAKLASAVGPSRITSAAAIFAQQDARLKNMVGAARLTDYMPTAAVEALDAAAEPASKSPSRIARLAARPSIQVALADVLIDALEFAGAMAGHKASPQLTSLSRLLIAVAVLIWLIEESPRA